MRKLLIILAALTLLPAPCLGFDKKLLSAAGMQDLAEEAPVFTLTSPSGKKTTLRENRGRVVIIHIWATWCKPCKDEFPLFERLYRGFKEKGVVFLPVAIDTNADIQEIEAFAKGLGATFDVYLAGDGDITDKYWTWGVPVTYFVDKKGKMAARALGPRDWGSDEVRALIEALIDE
ncbi:MAG: TlpA family protein disulfide reductase [Deltaproteobacteria bacterium]|nr:TlpA family protein disulfide reductase [Deltaproteobacteria bacterium]